MLLHGLCVGLTNLPLSVSRLSRQCRILIIPQPYRPPRPVTGVALLLLQLLKTNPTNSGRDCFFVFFSGDVSPFHGGFLLYRIGMADQRQRERARTHKHARTLTLSCSHTYSSVDLVTGYGLDGWDSIPGKVNIFFAAAQRQDWLWGPPSSL
jgi:hypothetical protein